MRFTKHDEAEQSPSRRKSYEIPFHLTSLFDRKMYTYIIFEYRNNQKNVEQHFRSQFPDGNLKVARECFCMSNLCKSQVEKKLLIKSPFFLSLLDSGLDSYEKLSISCVAIKSNTSALFCSS